MQTFIAVQGELDDICERMASEILNIFSVSVFLNLTELRILNLPEIIKHVMLRGGGRF